MKTKNVKTDSIKGAAEDTTEEYHPPIYLALQGNDWQTNGYLMLAAITEARAHDQKLYVSNQSGGPKDPPPCFPGQPNCP